MFSEFLVIILIALFVLLVVLTVIYDREIRSEVRLLSLIVLIIGILLFLTTGLITIELQEMNDLQRR